MSRVKRIDDFSAQEINMMPKTARPIGVRPLNPESMRTKYADRVRHGKTAKDRKRKIKGDD